MLRDFSEQGLQEREFASIFIGGGTPSLFPPKLISKLLAHVKTSVAPEITIEVKKGVEKCKHMQTPPLSKCRGI